MKTITICSSANFYKTVVELQEQLEKAGFKVLVPETATKMKKSGDYDASHYRTWLGDANDYPKKARLIRLHFGEITKSDAVLVVNNQKHGVKNYIGGNVLMEMGLAFHLKLPIYLWNDVPSESNFLEEILAMTPIALNGRLDKLVKAT